MDYWQNEYDWHTHEAKLNELPHFKAEIDDIGIYFIHQKEDAENSIPLILTHGWPDSFYRYYKIVGEPASSSGDDPSFFGPVN